MSDAIVKITTAELEALRKDKARLDFLDRMNAALNGHYGTRYGWRLIFSHNVNRLFLGHLDIDLNDAQAHGLRSCREAIDDERRRIDLNRTFRRKEHTHEA